MYAFYQVKNINKRDKRSNMEPSRIIVGVLMGGSSLESEVSFNSGRTICDHLEDKYIIKPIFQTKEKKLYYLPWSFLYRGKIADFENRLEKEAQLINLETFAQEVDFIYLALHGKSGEDGTIQGLLELIGIPYLGSGVKGSILGMAKKFQHYILNKAGLKTPKTIVYQALEIKNKIKKKIDINFPLIVKPAFEGSSIGIKIVNSQDELELALEYAGLISGIYDDVLIQEYIIGREFSCTIITDPKNGHPLALPITEIIIELNSKYFSYEQKYMPGRAHKITPANISTETTDLIKNNCIKIMNLLNISTIMRVDGFLKENNEIIFLDVNTIPGTGPTSFLFDQSAEAGYSYNSIINMLIESELKWGKKYYSHKKTSYKIFEPEEKTIAILMGGASNEKEISLESGRNVFYKLKQQNFKVVPIFVDSNLQLFIIPEKILVKNSTNEIIEALKEDKPISWPSLKKCDFVFLALHGGAGENGIIQSALQALDIKFNGSKSLASSICMDKYLTKIILEANGFDTIPGVLVDQETFKNKELYKDLNWPLIVKPHDDGCSFFVFYVNNETELFESIEKILAYKKYALVEEYILAKELTIGIINTPEPICLPSSEVIRTGKILSIEEKFLPGAGENQTPAILDINIQEFIKEQLIRAYNIIGCKNYARIDCFLQDEKQSKTGKYKLIFIEFNTLPALTPATCLFHQAAEINMRPTEFLKKIIENANT